MAFTIIDEIHIERAPHFPPKCFHPLTKKGRAFSWLGLGVQVVVLGGG
jgi:hypothetical protein